VRISNDAAGSTAAWESYARTRTWLLEDSDGSKVVYASFMDGSGARSPVVSSSIELDRYAMIESVEITPVPHVYQPGATAHFRMRVEGNERGGGAGVSFENYSGSVTLYDGGLGGDAAAGDGSMKPISRSPSRSGERTWPSPARSSTRRGTRRPCSRARIVCRSRIRRPRCSS